MKNITEIYQDTYDELVYNLIDSPVGSSDFEEYDNAIHELIEFLKLKHPDINLELDSRPIVNNYNDFKVESEIPHDY